MRILRFAVAMLILLVVLASVFIFYILPKFDLSQVESNNGKVSILLLGKGGVGHEAPDLTDTIITGYLDLNTKKISMVSLPRDIWVDEIRAKLNSAYYWGKQKNQGYKLVDDAVKKITGSDINYHVVVDFSMFKDLVDAIGGIEVNVDKSFEDKKYPIAGKENDLCNGDKTYSCRYETIKFEKGVQKMDGETALKFVRSRNAVGTEGTDIAREARQQLVIGAIKSKLESKEFYLNLSKILKVKDVVLNNVETDLDLTTLIALSKKAFESRQNLSTFTIPENLLVVANKLPKYDNQYVFIPKMGSWSEFQKWLNQTLSNSVK